MKKTFSCLTVLLVSILLLVTSCSNATQIQFHDESKGNYTENGLSVLTVKVGETPEYRTAFPQDWTLDKMNLLVYLVKATPDETVVKGDELPTYAYAKAGEKFTYEEIIGGQATMELDPVKWDFTIEVFTATGPAADKNYDPLNKVLSGVCNDIDLATGGKMVEFPLKADTAVGSTAKGNIDINLYFYSEDNLSEVLVTTKKIGDGVIVKKPADGDITNFATSEGNPTTPVNGNENYRKYVYSGEIDVGTHLFTATFKNANDEILKYEEKIVIDGGNLTKKDIYIPQGSYNKPPVAATEVKVKSTYVPAVPVTISESKGIYATDVANDVDAIAGDKYKLNITWKDNSFNEEGYKITFTTSSPDASIHGNSRGESNIIEYQKDANPKISGPDKANITVIAGDLGPSTESVTISLPTGIFCENIIVTGFNAIGETGSDPIAEKKGMFTVAYDLQDPKIENAQITYNISGGKSANRYFVVGYDYGCIDPSIKKKGPGATYPFVDNKNFNFGGWFITVGTAPKSVELDTINSSNLAGDSGGPYDKKNQNITVKGSWTTTAGVSVKFPSYNGLKELQVLDTLMGEVLELDYNKNGTIGIPTGYTVANLKYAVYRPATGNETASQLLTTVVVAEDGLTATGGEQAGSIDYVPESKGIKITPKELLQVADCTGGIYRIYISYDYTDENGLTVPIDGNLYVRISNDAKN